MDYFPLGKKSLVITDKLQNKKAHRDELFVCILGHKMIEFSRLDDRKYDKK